MQLNTIISLRKIAADNDPIRTLDASWGTTYRPFGGVKTDYRVLGNGRYQFKNININSTNGKINPNLILAINRSRASHDKSPSTPMTDDQRILGGDYTLKELNIPASTHTIVSGDNPSRLAKRYGVPVGAIVKANPNRDFNRLQIGSSLNIPKYYRPSFKLPQYLIDTIIDIESAGDPNALGDIRNGKPYAEGLTQIREVFGDELAKYEAARKGKPKTYSYVLDEVNDRFKTTYKLADRRNAELSKKITKLWMMLFAENYYKKYNKYPTEEEMARSWNAGPNWRDNPKRKAKADEYHKKYVKSKIRRGYQ